MDILKGLNEKQYEAVINTFGPVMVMAGAGSGKTRVLTTRIAYLMHELEVNKYNILAVTFTNKAANEMKERIANMISEDTKTMWISTFHSFCARLLRIEADKLAPYSKYFNIIDEEDSHKILKDILTSLDADITPKELKSMISKKKNFNNYKFSDPYYEKIVNKALEEYNKYLKNNNLMDFDDLILNTIELLKNNKDIKEKYNNKFQYILIDEFQDTNEIQYDLIKLLVNKDKNIFVVGDDFQSIYAFRGAQIENINKFLNDYVGTNLILLEENYRSTPAILNLANDVIKHNENQIKKTMFTNNKNAMKPIYYEAQDPFGEAKFIVRRIKKLHDNKVKYKDIAVMYRSNYISRIIEDELVMNQIPHVLYGNISFYERMEVKDMIAYIKLMINHNDDFSFNRIINVPKRGIGNKTLEKLYDIKDEKQLSLFDSIDYYNGAKKEEFIKFKELINSLYSQLENIKLPDIVKIIVKETNYEEELKKNDKETYKDRLDNIDEFGAYLSRFEDEEGTNLDKLNNVIYDLSLRTDPKEIENIDSVVLTTYHQAKGLEFNTVFMASTNDGIFPSTTFLTNKKEEEEERRIFYVGVTRAKKNLYLLSTQTRKLYGETRIYSRSRFINELNEDLYDDYNNLPKKTKGGLRIGLKVNHKEFGNGLIVKIDEDELTIAFSYGIGIKKHIKAKDVKILK